jgi:DNA-directed RNA polymerase subunit RPC12/RpoP
MAKVFEFTCPICGSLCQTTDDMRGKHFQCLICTSKIIVPQSLDDAEGLDIEYFLKAGVVQQKLKDKTPPGSADQPPPAKK